MLVFCLSANAQINDHLQALDAYQGSWVIYTNDLKMDTFCLTVSDWSKDGQKLLASQLINGEQGRRRDSCFYSYDSVQKIYPYYETDEIGKKITSSSDIVIDGKTWIYQHHIEGDRRWRTLNLFNDQGDEISFRSQRSDDGGKTWTTTRSGKEYKVK